MDLLSVMYGLRLIVIIGTGLSNSIQMLLSMGNSLVLKSSYAQHNKFIQAQRG